MQEPKIYTCSNATLYPGGLMCDLRNACPCGQYEFGKPKLYEDDTRQKPKIVIRQIKPEEEAKSNRKTKKKGVSPEQGRLF